MDILLLSTNNPEKLLQWGEQTEHNVRLVRSLSEWEDVDAKEYDLVICDLFLVRSPYIIEQLQRAEQHQNPLPSLRRELDQKEKEGNGIVVYLQCQQAGVPCFIYTEEDHHDVFCEVYWKIFRAMEHAYQEGWHWIEGKYLASSSFEGHWNSVLESVNKIRKREGNE